jgi:hypothetical protein
VAAVVEPTKQVPCLEAAAAAPPHLKVAVTEFVAVVLVGTCTVRPLSPPFDPSTLRTYSKRKQRQKTKPEVPKMAAAKTVGRQINKGLEAKSTFFFLAAMCNGFIGRGE